VFFFFQIFVSYLIPLANNAFWHATLKLILLNDGTHVSFIFVAYVESMKSLLFTLPKAVMKEVFERFSAKAPKPLNTQFPDRTTKAVAVKNYQERAKKKNSTQLFPTSEEQDVLQQSTTVSAEGVASVTRRTSQKPRNCSKCKKAGHTRRTCQET